MFKLSAAPAKWVLQNTFSGAEAIYPESFDALPFELNVLWEI
jgi:hypothetical protein